MDNIVPQTRFYVYALSRPNKQSPSGYVVFYYGKGCSNRIDAHEMCARNRAACPHHTCRVIRKVWREGGQILKEKICDEVSEQAAFCVEKLMILIGRANNLPLVNKTLGGEGLSGFVWYEETKELRRQQELQRYSDPERIEQSRQLTKDLWQKPEYRDKLLEIRKSPRTRQKMSDAKKGVALRVQTYQGFMDPHKNVYAPVTNLQAFCREHSLSYCGMWLVSQGKQAHHQGWTLYPPKEFDTRKFHGPGFVSPSGQIYTDIPSLTEFCKEHGLSQPIMSQLTHGPLKSHKGWKRYDPCAMQQPPLL
jgi:hypothetical protein